MGSGDSRTLRMCQCVCVCVRLRCRNVRARGHFDGVRKAVFGICVFLCVLLCGGKTSRRPARPCPCRAFIRANISGRYGMLPCGVISFNRHRARARALSHLTYFVERASPHSIRINVKWLLAGRNYIGAENNRRVLPRPGILYIFALGFLSPLK